MSSDKDGDDFVWVKIDERAARLTTRGRLQPGDVVVEDRKRGKPPSKSHVWLSSIGKWVKAEGVDSRAPVFHDTDYDEERYKAVYNERMVANEDLKNPDASKTWYNYHKETTPDGRTIEGPRPFKSRAERRDYCKRYGYQQSGD